MHSKLKSIALFCLVSALPAFACGGGGGDDEVDGGAAIDSGQQQPDAMGSACDRNGFTVASAGAIDYGADAALVAFAASSAAQPTDFLGIEIFYELGATSGPHMYTFTDINYDTCHTCSLLQSNCTQQDGCEKSYLAIAGTLNVTATGVAGDTFTATLTGMEYVEVTINDQTFTSTKVTGGETWCLDSVSVSGTIVPPQQ